MAWSATAEPERFDEAVEWFADRFPLTTELAEQLGEYAGPRAWVIAGVTQLDIVLDVHRSLTKAIAEGTPLDQWKSEIESKLTKAWGRRNSARVETIFRNATQQSFNAGRWRQMSDPVMARLRPYARFNSITDERRTPFCKRWHGTVLHREEFARRRAVPQCHHRCRSKLDALSEREARRWGITDDVPNVQADKGFGAAPTDSEFQPDATKYPAHMFNEYQRKRDDIEEKAERRIPKVKKSAK